MKLKYTIKRHLLRNRRTNKSNFLRRNKSNFLRRNKNTKTRKRLRGQKILRGGILMPFSESSSIFGHMSNSFNNLINTVDLPPTPTYNPILPIDSSISSQLLNNVPTYSLSEIIS
jgi:hypothetical protein